MMRLPVTLALKEMRHDWQAAACFVAALVGVLAPLLIILALKNGMIAALLGRLIDDPSNRELIAVGAGQHNAAFFTEIAARDDVAFVMPATRSINAVANAVRHRDARKLERRVALIPSAPGDPLSQGAEVAPGAVLLSASLATALEANPGDTVQLRIDRRIDGEDQIGLRDLTVAGVVPAEFWSLSALFVSLPDLLAIERFRDDIAVTPETWTDPAPAPESYASFRLYAETLADVGPLERALASRGVDSRPRARNVELLIGFQRNLNILFAVIAVLATGGFWAAMAANLRGNVERQRVSLSLLSLMGMQDRARRLVPVVQSVVLVMVGVAATLLIIAPVLVVVNIAFSPESVPRVALLRPMDVLACIILGLATAVTASIWAAKSIEEITPDEVLHAN